MLERLREQLLTRWVGLACDHPRIVLTIAIGLAVLSLAWTVMNLSFKSDRNALIDQDLPWNRSYLDYLESFAGNDDLIVVVTVPETNEGPAQARRFVDALAQELGGLTDYVGNIDHGFDPGEVSPALIRMLPADRFKQRLDQIEQSQAVLNASGIVPFVTAISTSMVRQQDQMDASSALHELDRFGGFFESVGDVMLGRAQPHEPMEILDPAPAWQYLSSVDGRLLFVRVEPKAIEGQLDPFVTSVRQVRAAIARTTKRAPGVVAALTGVPVMEVDETVMTFKDSTKCSLVAIVSIAALLIFAFHGWVKPLLALIALLIGVIWTFGFLTIAIGYLQLLSIIFTVILLGLGIDFGIHLITRFELVRHSYGEGPSGFREAMIDTVRSTGPGIITGAITVAAAFGTTVLTKFRGMAEMGLIAAVGIILCLVSMLSVFPALMRLYNWRVRHVKPVHERPISVFEHAWLLPFVHRPGLTVFIAAVVVGVCAWTIPRIRYDYNLMNLMPRGVSSVEAYQLILEHNAQSVWFAVSMVPNRDRARQCTKQLYEMDSVLEVGGIGRLWPRDEAEKLEQIRAVRQRLGPVLQPPAAGESAEASATLLRQQIGTLETMIRMAPALYPAVRDDHQLAAALDQLAERMRTAGAAIGALDEQVAAARLASLNGAFVQWRDGLRRRIDEALSAHPLQVDQLPSSLHREAVGRDGSFAIKVFPKGNVYDPVQMEQFIEQVSRIDHHLTGTIVQIYKSSDLIKTSYMLAGLYALMVVSALVYLDFRYLLDAVLCLVPVSIAFVTMFGVMWLANVDVNPANIIVLPLLFGIGVGSGVHMLHRYRQAPRRRPPGLTEGTGKGILLTNATTMIGFASMLLAHHRGINSLGFVLTVGLGLTLLACLTVMPAILRMRWSWRSFYPGIHTKR